ncbi:MAG: hypothetical protein K2H53_01785, partial [Clostridia bacterium]|nr:hypothetical protein [Clostridia bacterium]
HNQLLFFLHHHPANAMLRWLGGEEMGIRAINKPILIKGNLCERRFYIMNYPELIWRLIEMLLQKDEKTNQSKADEVKDNTSNSQEQDEV